MEDDDEKPIVWEKSVFLNLPDFDTHPDVIAHDNYSDKRPLDVQMKANQFFTLPITYI